MAAREDNVRSAKDKAIPLEGPLNPRAGAPEGGRSLLRAADHFDESHARAIRNLARKAFDALRVNRTGQG